MRNSEFPDYYTIDDIGLDALCYFLKKEYHGKTVKIIVEQKHCDEEYCEKENK